MRAIRALVVAFAGACVPWATPSENAATAEPARPDMILFVIDDVAATDLALYGGPVQTPNLQALAGSGVLYTRAYSHAKCAPTRDSICYATWRGLDRGDSCTDPITTSHAPGDLSLPKVFEAAGYSTCHIGKWHTGVTDRGRWEVTPELIGFGSSRATAPVGPTCNVQGAYQGLLNDGVYSVSNVDSSIRCRDALLAWWAETPSPKMAVVEFGSAHAPFNFPPITILPPGYPRPPNSTNRQRFEAEIVGVDFVIGQVIAQIGVGPYILFCGDNGTPEDATRTDQDPGRVKLTCYEDGVRVPLLISGPGIAAKTSPAMLQLYDLMPTMAQMAGLWTPPTEGRKFGGTLVGAAGPTDPIFCWNPPPNLDRAMIGPRWKLLVRPDGAEELYDLEADPHETSPLPLTGPEYDDLHSRLQDILNGV